jgi:hypothetical protein
MPVSWKKALLYAAVAVGGCALAVVVIGIAAPLIAVAIGCVLGFSGSAAVKSAGKTGVNK